MFRKTYAEIDPAALENNVRQIKAAYPDYRYYFGVVKGNAYGHGMQCAKALAAGGVNYFATATLEEALRLRDYEYDIPVHRLDYLKQLLEVAPQGTKIHLKLDTGMNRLGFKSAEDVKAAVELINSAEGIVLEGVYTHLATSGLNDPYYDRQTAAFLRLTAGIDLSAVPIVHMDRSLTLVHHKKPDFVNGTRLGICMYGFSQSVQPPSGLRALKRRLSLLKTPISLKRQCRSTAR